MGEEIEARFVGIIRAEDEEGYMDDEVAVIGESARKSLEELIDAVEVEPAPPKAITLNERIKEYVRTMHVPPVTNWRELSDSEEGEDGGREANGAATKYVSELDLRGPSGVETPETKEEESDWGNRKEKLTAPSKSSDEAHHICLLDVLSYGHYFHMPHEEMELRNEEQCYGCQQPGEQARCVCCGGSSIISPNCFVPKGHVKQRLVKESRVYHLLASGREFSETDLHGWESSERELADVCGVKSAQK